MTRANEGSRPTGRLDRNLIAWLTTVDGEGQPWTTPVWFLAREDGTVLLYTTPGSAKLRHLARNPRVSLVLDGSDLGRDVVRVRGLARVEDTIPAASANEAYRTKYLERIGVMFGDPEAFAARFSVPLVIVPVSAAAPDAPHRAGSDPAGSP